MMFPNISVQATADPDNKVGCHHCKVPNACSLASEGVVSSADTCYAICEQHPDCLGIQYDNQTQQCSRFYSNQATCYEIEYAVGDVFVYRKSARTGKLNVRNSR